MKIALVCLFFCLALLSTANCANTPKLEITSCGDYGTAPCYIYGKVSGIDSPNNYWVAVFIYVPGLGWYSKPYCDQSGAYSRVVSIASNNLFYANTVTGGIDHFASIVEAYLIRKSDYPACYPSCVSGQGTPPLSVQNVALGSDRILKPNQRTINWSGYKWIVKHSIPVFVGPAAAPGYGNYFSNSSDNVWVDSNGKLHLKIVYDSNNRWTCAEINTVERLGYGTYKFYCDSRLDDIDKRAVLGLFTWSDMSSYVGAYREMDVEFSKWGVQSDPNAQYVIQPWDTSGNRYRFNTSSAVTSTHTFTWQPTNISFSSTEGHNPGGTPIASWSFTRLAGIPVSLDERVHINLWLNNTALPLGPSNSQPVEVVISKFEFTPWTDPARPTLVVNGEGANHALTRTVSDKYRFKLFGKVTAKDTTGLSLDDGSTIQLRVLDPGHTFSVGDFLSVSGTLSGSTPKLINTSPGRITLIQ